MSTQSPAPFNGTLTTVTYPNKFNVVVPPEGPFYRVGLVLKTPAGRNLIEGLDYYLCYYFKEAADALQAQVFGGIMLLTETTVQYTINSVGREYRVPQSEIGKFLVNPDLKDPRNIDWASLMRYAPVVPAIDPPHSLDEAILRDEVVAQLDRIRVGILARATEMDSAFAAVTEQIFQVGKKIFDDNLYQHHKIKNAHQYTAEEIGALKLLTKAVDCTRAFGRTVDELVEVMKVNGIQQTHIDTLMPVVLGELRGRLRVINNGALTFRTADSSHVITMQGDKFLITTTKPLTLIADADNNDPGIAVEVSAGLNAMYVASGAKAPIFNGAYLITPEMVSLYLSAVKLLPANAYFESTDSLKIYGTAQEFSPVNMNAVLPLASATEAGLLLVTNLSANIAAGAAISQKAVSALKSALDNYVDNTYTVNGKGFVLANDRQDLTLSAGDFGLDQVTNTAPIDKPVTNAIKTALTEKAPLGHAHTFGDLTGVPTASDTDAGLVQLWDAIDATTDKVVTSKQGYAVQQRINTLREKVNDLLPSWAMGGQSFGNPGYLPIPGVGNFEGFARNTVEMMGAAKVEGDVVYLLLNCHSGTQDSRRIYYAYGNVNADNSVTDIKKTSFRYQPEGMTTKYPGVYLREIVISGAEGLIARGSDDRLYMVNFNGTLNYRKHTTVCALQFEDYAEDTTAPFVPNMHTDVLTFDGTTFYVTRANINGNYSASAIYRVGYYSFPLSGLAANSLVVKQAKVNYSRMVGKCADIVAPGSYVNEVAGTSKFAYVTPAANAAWPRALELTRGPNQRVTAQCKGGVLRIGGNHQSYYFGNVQNTSYGTWSSAVDIDVATGNLTLLTDFFPLIIDADGVYTRDRVKLGLPVKWNTRQSWYTVVSLTDVGDGRSVNFHVSTETNRDYCVEIQKLPDGVSFFDFLAMQYGGAQFVETHIPDGRGSVIRAGMSAPLFFPGTRKVWLNDVTSADCVEAEYDPAGSYGVPGFGGFGPTNNRTIVPWATYASMAQIPMVVNAQNPNGLLDGAHFIGPATLPYRGIVGSTGITADRLTVADADWAVLRQAIIDQAQAGSANGYASERIAEAAMAGGRAFGIDLWVLGLSQSDGPLVIAMVSTINMVTDRNYLSTYFYQLTPQIVAGKMSFAGVVLKSVGFRANAMVYASQVRQDLFDGNRNRRVGQASLFTADGAKYRLTLPFAMAAYMPGGTYAISLALTLTKAAGVWSGSVAALSSNSYVYPAAVYETYVPDLGGFAQLSNGFDPSLLGGPLLKASDLVNGVTTSLGSVIITGMKTAEGWNFYTTEQTVWRIGATEFMLAPWSVDLKQAFPANYQNQTFYLYVVRSGDSAHYELSTQRLQDTTSRLWVGKVTTDDARITGLEINKVKRLGNVKQLAEHQGVSHSHDLNVAVDAANSPLGLLRKVPLTDDMATPGNYFDSRYYSRVTVSQLRPTGVPVVKKPVKNFLGAEDGNMAFRFSTQLKMAAATQAENASAYAAGRIWVGLTAPSLPASSMSFSAFMRVTPTKNQLRVKLYYPAGTTGQSVASSVNGVDASCPVGSTVTATIGVVPNVLTGVRVNGLLLTAMVQAWGNKLVAFAIYDYDAGTNTETLLAASGPDTEMTIDATGVKGFPGTVQQAELIPYPDSNGYVPVVMAGGVETTPPALFVPEGVIVATKWCDLIGRKTASDLAVHFMSTSF